MEVPKNVQDDIIEVLKNIKRFVSEDNAKGVLEWSDHIIHSASIYQDEYTLTLAVMAYSLGKVMEMEELKEKKGAFGKFCAKCDVSLDLALSSAEKGDWNSYMKALQSMIKQVSKAGESYSGHLQHVLNAAKVKKGSKMFMHGISMGRVAETLGVSKWDLMNYVGQTSESEFQKLSHADLKHKFKTAKEALE